MTQKISIIIINCLPEPSDILHSADVLWALLALPEDFRRKMPLEVEAFRRYLARLLWMEYGIDLHVRICANVRVCFETIPEN